MQRFNIFNLVQLGYDLRFPQKQRQIESATLRVAFLGHPLVFLLACLLLRPSGQGEEPADVGRGDKVPGGAHEVGAKDGSVNDGLFDVRFGCVWQPQPNGPEGRRVFLGLDSDEMGDDSGRVFNRVLEKELVL